jgi:hypothetical protein
MAEKKANPHVVWAVSILLALVFAGLGVLLFLKPQPLFNQSVNGRQLADYYLTGLGVVFCSGAVLLLVPRLAWIGALLLAVVLSGIIGVSVVHGSMSQIVIPGLLVVSLVTLAYIRRPGGVFSTPKKDAAAEPPAANASPPAATGSGPPAV